MGIGPYGSACRGGRPCPPNSGNATLCRAGPVCPAGGAGKESPSHGFAVPAPFRQGGQGDGGCGLPRPVTSVTGFAMTGVFSWGAVERADVGSELSAASGRGSEVSEWPRSKFPASAVRQRRNFGHRNRGIRNTLAQSQRGTDCHTSDIGHWFAMTGGFTWGAVFIGRHAALRRGCKKRGRRADVGIGPYGSACRGGRPCPPSPGNATLCRAGPVYPAGGAGKESPSHGFAVPAPFRQGGQGDGGCGLPHQ